MVPLSKSGLRLYRSVGSNPTLSARSELRGRRMNDKKKCFVIMPFAKVGSPAEQKWTEIFEHTIKPAVEESGCGHKCERYKFRRANIIKDILQELNNAPVVIADLTDSNPNVLWELGVRHTLSRRTILVAQNKKFLPSDLKDYPITTYKYKQTPKEAHKFRQEIEDKLKDIEAEPEKPDSPVADFLENKNYDLLTYEKSANLRKLDALLSELSYNVIEIDNIMEQLSAGTPPYSRLQNTCIKLLLSTRYINITAKVLDDTSLCNRIAEWLNKQLDFAHQSLIMDLEKLPKILAEGLPKMKGNFINLLSSFAKIRTDFASDNYQEPKEPIIKLASPEHEKYLKLTT
jgi:hypothetical protein